MNSVAAVQWLRRAWEIDEEIQMLEESKEEAYSRALRVTNHLSGVGRPSSPDPHKFDAYVSLAYSLVERERTLLMTKAEISRAVALMGDSNCRRILHYRFLDCYTWPQVQEKMQYSETQCKRFYRKAVQDITPIIEKISMSAPLCV